MNKQFYILSHGWATKYYWLNVLEKVILETNFAAEIKKKKLTFLKYSGTSEADLYGSSIAYTFFSENIISIFKEAQINSYTKYSVKFDNSWSLPSKLYLIEIKSSIPKIQNEDIFTKPDLTKY
ncbi:MAG: hypothetical protein H7195_11155 [Chryseobacterium sp.]|nr:hypothetical protein [Chryseobacterium sp.]